MNDFAHRADRITWPDHAAGQRAYEQAQDLGTLDLLAGWVAGVQGGYPPAPIVRARLVVFAADHGIAAADVSRHELGYAATVAADIITARASLCRLAELSGTGVRVISLPTSGRIDREDALTPEAVAAAVSVGLSAADDEIDGGADLLIIGGVGAGATTAAAALISALTGTEPVRVVGRGSDRPIDDTAWMRKATAVRDARRRAWPHRGDPVQLLQVAGGADIAAMAGFAFEAAVRRTPVLLDGVVAAAAGLVAAAAQPRVTGWWRAAQLSPDPAHARALGQLGLSPVLDLGISSGDGTGGLLVLPLIQAALRRHASADV